MKSAPWYLILSLLTISAFGVAPAWAADCGGATVCACGDTVVADYVLPASLTCGDAAGESVDGFTVAAGVEVDLNGFRLAGTDQQGVGLLLQGCCGSVHGGRIQNFHVGIDSDGPTSFWKIGVDSPLTVTSNASGLSLTASHTMITDLAATSNAIVGLHLTGDTNTIERITCSKNGGAGFIALGDHNVLTNNRCERNGHDGLFVGGDWNVLVRNLATGNGGSGVVAIGNGNSFQTNQGRNNGGDGVRGVGPGLSTDGRNYGALNDGTNCLIDGFTPTGGGRYC